MDWSSILVGAFLGLVLLPVVYDCGLFLVMRSEFLVWHAMRAIALAVMAVAGMRAGFPAPFDAEITRQHLQLIATDLSIAVSGPFLVSYVEAGKIGPRLRALLRATMPVVLITSLLYLGLGRSQALDTGRNLLFLATLILLIAGLAQALRRGSRAARYQTAAWSAVFAVCAVSLFQELFLSYQIIHWITSILLAIVVEIVVTAAGVADRFMVMRRDRDEAERRALEATSEAMTDPLTGLRNRRGLHQRFASRDRQQPRAFAIFDVDHFKRINDTHGHDVGDEVLVAVARALSSEDCFAARLGGEEFAVILFHDNWPARVEAIRSAITHAVARDVPSLTWNVTVSAGVAKVSSDTQFPELLKRADRALYRSKHGGRDRTTIADGGGREKRAAA